MKKSSLRQQRTAQMITDFTTFAKAAVSCQLPTCTTNSGHGHSKRTFGSWLPPLWKPQPCRKLGQVWRCAILMRIFWQNVEHTHPKNWKILRDRLMLLIPTDSCFWFLLISSSSSLEWSSSSKWRSQHDGLPSGGLTTYAMESRHVSTEHHLITRTDPCCILFAYPFGFGWT